MHLVVELSMSDFLPIFMSGVSGNFRGLGAKNIAFVVDLLDLACEVETFFKTMGNRCCNLELFKNMKILMLEIHFQKTLIEAMVWSHLRNFTKFATLKH